MARGEVVVYDEEIVETKPPDGIRTGKSTERAPRLTFDMLGIPIGSQISYYADSSVTVTVVDRITTVRIDDHPERSLSICALARRGARHPYRVDMANNSCGKRLARGSRISESAD